MTAAAKTDSAPEKNTPHDFSVGRFRSFDDIFAYNRQYIPERKVFVQGEDRALSYGRLDDLTSRMCTFFKQNNLEIGDRAILISRDNLAVITIFMACLRYGLTAVILNPDSGYTEQKNMIAAARPRAFFVDKAIGEELKIAHEKQENKDAGSVYLPVEPGADQRPPSVIKKIFGQKPDKSLYPHAIYDLPRHDSEKRGMATAPVPDDTTAYILFTSGTTSRPKGVEISHANLLAQMQTFVRQYGYDPQSRILDILPLHHTDGLTQGPVVAFTIGAGAYRPLRFTVDKLPFLLDSIYAHRITHFIAVPSMLQLIDTMGEEADEAFQTEDFRFVISTAGYLDPNLWERFETRFKTRIVNVYGLTETVCESLYCGPDEDTRKLGTIGKPVDTQARIVDESGDDIPQGEAGELWLKGAHIMKGYFDMPEETAAALTDDGWFKTGDLCKVDDEGYYHIVGRKKNIIIVGGINIYPEDVANILRTLPGVVDAVVWGENDPMWGEIVVAAVEPEKGADVDTSSLGEAFLDEAAVEMMPRRIHVIDEFPRGPAGKVILRDLKDKVAEKQAAKTAETGGDIDDKIMSLAADIFKTPEGQLEMSDTAETVKGWNSLAHVEFLLTLEKQFDIKIGPRDIMSVKTLADARDLVESKI